MKYITTTLIAFLISTNITFANDKYITDLEYINDNLAILINKIVTNNYTNIDPIKKELEFIESLLATVSYKVDTDYKIAKQKGLLKDQAYYLDIDNISNFYEMSAINIRLYLKKDTYKDNNIFLDLVSSFNNGETNLITLKNKISKD